eukprot:363869-Chlamydomonas_euryale.AAC.33
MLHIAVSTRVLWLACTPGIQKCMRCAAALGRNGPASLDSAAPCTRWLHGAAAFWPSGTLAPDMTRDNPVGARNRVVDVGRRPRLLPLGAAGTEGRREEKGTGREGGTPAGGSHAGGMAPWSLHAGVGGQPRVLMPRGGIHSIIAQARRMATSCLGIPVGHCPCSACPIEIGRVRAMLATGHTNVAIA